MQECPLFEVTSRLIAFTNEPLGFGDVLLMSALIILTKI